MGNKAVNIFIRKGKAYIPTLAKTDMGVYMDIDPVYIVDPNIDNLANAIDQVFRTGNPKIPHPTRDQIKRLPHPVFKAAKVSSWKKFTEGCKCYGISWVYDGLILEFFKLGEKRSFIPDRPKTRAFPPGTNMREIVQAILDDLHSRPELQG